MTCSHDWGEPLSSRAISGRIVRQIFVCKECRKVRIKEFSIVDATPEFGEPGNDGAGTDYEGIHTNGPGRRR